MSLYDHLTRLGGGRVRPQPSRVSGHTAALLGDDLEVAQQRTNHAWAVHILTRASWNGGDDARVRDSMAFHTEECARLTRVLLHDGAR